MTDIEWLLSAGLAFLGLGIGAWFRFGPGAKFGAMADAILGTPKVLDRGGGILEQGSPGLTQRVSTLEDAINTLADQQRTLAEHTQQINDLRLADAIQAEQIGLLKLAASERIATADVAKAALNLVRDEQTATAEQHPEEP